MHRAFKAIGRRLASAAFLAGPDYSVADIATYAWARLIPALVGAPAAAGFPNVMRWVKTIDARPAVQKALAAVEDVRNRTTAFDKADPATLDKVFGRGQFAAA